MQHVRQPEWSWRQFGLRRNARVRGGGAVKHKSLYSCPYCEKTSTVRYAFLSHSKMPTVRKARSLVTSRELPSGLQIWGKRPLNALFSVGTMNPDTDSASEESVKVIQERVAHGTLYVRLTCPTMANRHNKLYNTHI